MNISNYINRIKWHRVTEKGVYSVLPGVVASLLVILLAYSLAGYTWRLFPASNAATGHRLSNARHPGTTQSSRQVDTTRLKQYSLFGNQMSQESVVADDNAPKQISFAESGLKLIGIFTTLAPKEQAFAIIQKRDGTEKIYSVGEDIDSPPAKITLLEIHTDHVILRYNGQRVQLLLFKMENGGDGKGQSSASGTGDLQPSESIVLSDDETRKKLEKMRTQFRTNPASLSALIQWPLVMKNGEIKGVRVAYNKDPEMFGHLGFEENDVLTGINGIRLNDPAIYGLIQNPVLEGGFQITVERNGIEEVIEVDVVR